MIAADRFIETSDNYEAWLAARSNGVTATEVSTAATPAGFTQALAERVTPTDFTPNEYMTFGSDSEREIMRHAHREYGILPSNWLIAAADNPRHLATPDGLSVDHTEIAEAKTTGTDWEKPPLKYLRQIWWQLRVTDAERCLLLWQLRVPDGHGWFYLGWLEPKTLWIERDDKKIRDLIEVADRLLEASDGR